MQAATQINLLARNNVDWIHSFTFYTTYGSLPWIDVPAWATSIAYTSVSPASVITYDGGAGPDLYVANPIPQQTWTSAGTFAADAANWILVKTAASYAATGYDFTGSVLKMTLVQTDVNGNVLLPKQVIATLTSDGSDNNPISIINGLSTGNISLNYLAPLANKVPPGTYNFDMISINGSVTTTAMWGTISVFQGAT